MKYFFDTEFIEWAGGIDLVSIGIVSEDGDTFYAESTNFDERNADQWVKDNVLAKLEWWGNENANKGFCNSFSQQQPGNTWKTEVFGTEALIASELLAWIGNPSTKPEFYAYYGAYDWVLFARLFGRLINLPKGFPMYVMDLKQMMDHERLDSDWKRTVCPDPEGEHNALADAHWNKKLYQSIINNKT